MNLHLPDVAEFIAAHPYCAHWTVFLLALSEAIPIVGTVVPGSTLVVAISALATASEINAWLLVIDATLGAIVRAFVPLIAGAFRMPIRQFYVANVLSALIWAPAHVFPGVAVGVLASAANASTWHIVALAIAVILLGWIASRIARYYFDRGIVRWPDSDS